MKNQHNGLATANCPPKAFCYKRRLMIQRIQLLTHIETAGSLSQLNNKLTDFLKR